MKMKRNASSQKAQKNRNVNGEKWGFLPYEAFDEKAACAAIEKDSILKQYQFLIYEEAEA